MIFNVKENKVTRERPDNLAGYFKLFDFYTLAVTYIPLTEAGKEFLLKEIASDFFDGFTLLDENNKLVTSEEINKFIEENDKGERDD